ncbi:MAG: hypothetical protein ACK2UU_01325 [Anaerolineae bacterium]
MQAKRAHVEQRTSAGNTGGYCQTGDPGGDGLTGVCRQLVLECGAAGLDCGLGSLSILLVTPGALIVAGLDELFG